MNPAASTSKKSKRSSKRPGSERAASETEVSIIDHSGNVLAVSVWPPGMWEGMEKRAKERGVSVDRHICELILADTREAIARLKSESWSSPLTGDELADEMEVVREFEAIRKKPRKPTSAEVVTELHSSIAAWKGSTQLGADEVAAWNVGALMEAISLLEGKGGGMNATQEQKEAIKRMLHAEDAGNAYEQADWEAARAFLEKAIEE